MEIICLDLDVEKLIRRILDIGVGLVNYDNFSIGVINNDIMIVEDKKVSDFFLLEERLEELGKEFGDVIFILLVLLKVFFVELFLSKDGVDKEDEKREGELLEGLSLLL